jgi:3-oxoacyl-[acyl-carrier protein] reductase
VTKAAQLSLSWVFADAYAGSGVLINAVAPGPVESPLWTAEGGLADEIARRRGVTRDEALAATREKVSLARMGAEDEIAAVIAFLRSEPAPNVAGGRVVGRRGLAPADPLGAPSLAREGNMPRFSNARPTT